MPDIIDFDDTLGVDNEKVHAALKTMGPSGRALSLVVRLAAITGR